MSIKVIQDANGKYCVQDMETNTITQCCCVHDIAMAKELYKYQEMEENGLLLKLPVPIGTHLYEVMYEPYDKVYFVQDTIFQITDIALYHISMFEKLEDAKNKCKEKNKK